MPVNANDVLQVLLRAGRVKVWDSGCRPLATRQLAILLYLKVSGDYKAYVFRTTALAKELKIPRTTVIRNLIILENEGWVKIKEFYTGVGRAAQVPELTKRGHALIKSLTK